MLNYIQKCLCNFLHRTRAGTSFLRYVIVESRAPSERNRRVAACLQSEIGDARDRESAIVELRHGKGGERELEVVHESRG